MDEDEDNDDGDDDHQQSTGKNNSDITRENGNEQGWELPMLSGGDNDASEMLDDSMSYAGINSSDRDHGEEEKARIKAQLLLQQEDDSKEFPDEVETPSHIPCRTRFAKYRGLQSFRSSPWDPKGKPRPTHALPHTRFPDE